MKNVIESTFQILPTVGPAKESAIWACGIKRWKDFIDSENIPCLSDKKREMFIPMLENAYGLLKTGDCSALASMLKSKEHWRLYSRFKNETAYLDIETNGLDRESLVTVVTIHRLSETITLVQGETLNENSLMNALKDVSFLVTFNGSCFDLPVLKHNFPDVNFNLPHFDLRFGCKKVGLCGGLKNIEKTIGICRDNNISEVDGFEAVRLWNKWTKYGDKDSLNKLVEYNVADTVNLKRLADHTYERMVDLFGCSGH